MRALACELEPAREIAPQVGGVEHREIPGRGGGHLVGEDAFGGVHGVWAWIHGCNALFRRMSVGALAGGMSPRCPSCAAPVADCFCAEIPRVTSRVPVVIVRHVAERHKVSATGVLTARVIGGRVLDHGGADGPVALGDLGGAPHLLFTGGREGDWPVPSALVVLDGTWGQVRQMRRRVPGLVGMPTLTLPRSASRPRMREQHLPEGMSTLEAVADALEVLGEPEPARALREIYGRMTALWLDLRGHRRAL